MDYEMDDFYLEAQELPQVWNKLNIVKIVILSRQTALIKKLFAINSFSLVSRHQISLSSSFSVLIKFVLTIILTMKHNYSRIDTIIYFCCHWRIL